jgi:uncharacterized protein (TIGR03437 family)
MSCVWRGVVLTLAFSAIAFAGDVACVLRQGTEANLRQEGSTERFGDVLLQCNGPATPAGQKLPMLRFKIYSPVPIANVQIADKSSATDALLIADDPNKDQFVVASPVPGLGVGTTRQITSDASNVGTYRFPNENIFYLQQDSLKSLTTVIPYGGGQHSFRFTGARGDVRMFPAGKISLTVSVTDYETGQSIFVADSPAGTVARAATSTYTSWSRGHSDPVNASLKNNQTPANAQPFIIQYKETFPNSFRSPIPLATFFDDPLGDYSNYETGYFNSMTRLVYPPNVLGTTIGGSVTNLPSGNNPVFVAVPNNLTSGNFSAKLITPGLIPLGSTGLSQLAVTNGRADFYYQVVSSDPKVLETATVSVYLYWDPCFTVSTCPPAPTDIVVRGGMVADIGGAYPQFDESFRSWSVGATLLSQSGQAPTLTFCQPSNCWLSQSPSPTFNDSSNGCRFESGMWGLISPNYASANTTVSLGSNPNINATVGTTLKDGVASGTATGTAPFTFQLGFKLSPSLSFDPKPSAASASGSSRSVAAAATPQANTPPATAFTIPLTATAPGLPTLNTNVNVNVLSRSTPLVVPSNFTDVADYRGPSVAPGQIFSLFPDFYPQTASLVQSTLDANGKLPTLVGDTQVLFDDVPSPLLFVTKNQIAGVAPFGLAGKSTTQMKIVYKGVESPAVTMSVKTASVSIVSGDSSGGGTCACLNSNSTLNSKANPARPGDVVVLIVAYGGPMDIPGTDGRTTFAAPYPKPKGPVTATIGGIAVVDFPYVGNLPGYVESAEQWNIRIPPTAKSGPNVLQISAGGATSANWTVIWVQ